MDSMPTYTGKLLNLDRLKLEDIDIKDVAHHLSNICCFNGACRWFYSVAQHSLTVAGLVGKEMRLWALLHEAPKAYYGDVLASQVDNHLYEEIRHANRPVDVIVFRRFGLLEIDEPYLGLPPEVRKANDKVRLAEEQLMSEPFIKVKVAKTIPIVPMTPEAAEHQFLDMYHRCYGGK